MKIPKISKKAIYRTAVAVLVLALTFMFALSVCNIAVIASAKNNIKSFDECADMNADCIIVPGAGLSEDGTPSSVLADRLTVAAQLCFANASQKILVSGDHGSDSYDEPNAMKDYLISLGVGEERIFTDHAGFSTYDTLYRAKEIFKAEKVIIVTQDFHISRAVFTAKALGLEACGVTSDLHRYSSEPYNEIRETAARGAYMLKAIFKPEPKYLGNEIPITGDAEKSNG